MIQTCNALIAENRRLAELAGQATTVAGKSSIAGQEDSSPGPHSSVSACERFLARLKVLYLEAMSSPTIPFAIRLFPLQVFSNHFGELCVKMGRRVKILADVNTALECHLDDMEQKSGPSVAGLAHLSQELERVTNERDEMTKKYNLMVVAWALERGKKVQCQREVEEYKRHRPSCTLQHINHRDQKRPNEQVHGGAQKLQESHIFPEKLRRVDGTVHLHELPRRSPYWQVAKLKQTQTECCGLGYDRRG